VPNRYIQFAIDWVLALYIYVYNTLCVYLCMHMYIYIYPHTHTHTHTHMYDVINVDIYVFIYTCMHIFTYKNTCTYTHIYTHMYTYTYTHTHTYRYIQRVRDSLLAHSAHVATLLDSLHLGNQIQKSKPWYFCAVKSLFKSIFTDFPKFMPTIGFFFDFFSISTYQWAPRLRMAMPQARGQKKKQKTELQKERGRAEAEQGCDLS